MPRLRAWPGVATPSRLFVPGRIEVLGKHTDYAGGRSLTCAAERGFSVSYVPRDDDLLRLVDARDGRARGVSCRRGLSPEAGHWSNYPMTVARRVARNFGPLDSRRRHRVLRHVAEVGWAEHLERAHHGRVPRARRREPARRASPSSRPRFPTTCIWQDSWRASRTAAPLAGLPATDGVGTFGGSEDHTAILLSQAGRLTWYRYQPVTPMGSVALDPGCAFAIAASGIAAAKTGSAREKYNRASALVAQLLARWNAATGRGDATLAAALDAEPDAAARLRALAAEPPRCGRPRRSAPGSSTSSSKIAKCCLPPSRR